jgi:hypothetical protein
MDFDLCSTLEESLVGRKVIDKYFPGVWDTFKLNDICSSYLLRKNKEKSKQTEGNVRDCLDKIADVLDILQETTYPLYVLKMNLNKVAVDTDGPLAGNLRKTAEWFNAKIYELENNQLDNDILKACADAAREAAAEIPAKTGRGSGTLFFAERRLIVDIAELFQNIHGEWPLRQTKFSGSTGPLDEIMATLGDILGCGALTKLIRDFDTDLKERVKKEQAGTKTRKKGTGSQNLITD